MCIRDRYLRAWCEKRGAMSTFKICRMDEVELLHEGLYPARLSTEGEEAGAKTDNGGDQPPLQIVLRFADVYKRQALC